LSSEELADVPRNMKLKQQKKNNIVTRNHIVLRCILHKNGMPQGIFVGKSREPYGSFGPASCLSYHVTPTLLFRTTQSEIVCRGHHIHSTSRRHVMSLEKEGSIEGEGMKGQMQERWHSLPISNPEVS
jgi:hypothetical protein